MAGGGVFVAGLAGNLIVAGEVVGGLDHAGDDPEAGVAHALDAAGDHHVGGPGLDHHCRVDHRLQPAAATAVELIARDGDRQAGGQGAPPGDARRLAVAIALGEDHIIDLFRIDLGALDQGGEDGRAQVAGGDRRKGPKELAHRRADGADDGGALHGGISYSPPW